MNWNRVASGSSVIDGVACNAPAQCVAVTSNAEQDLYTQDGTNWSPGQVQSVPGLAVYPMNGVTCSGTICMAAGNQGWLARSTDRGASWSFLHLAATVPNLDAIDCPTDSRCLAAGSNGIVVTSVDGGKTWTRHKSPTSETLLGMTCETPEDCLAVGSGRTVISTDDGGTDWVVRAGNATPKMKTSVLVVGDSFAHTLAVYVGRDSPAYGVSIVDLGLDGCGLARGRSLGGPQLGIPQAVTGPCADTGRGWPSIYRANVSRLRPSLSLLVLGPWDLASRLVDGHWLSPGETDYDAYYRRQMTTAVHILTSDGGPRRDHHGALRLLPGHGTVCPSSRNHVGLP